MPSHKYFEANFSKCFVKVFSLLIFIVAPTLEITFDEVSSLHVWLTVSSLANRDPTNHKSLTFRQIELNWINAPLEDPNDYLALYLDGEPRADGAHDSLPVSVHKINGHTNGKIITDYYLPQFDFEQINGSCVKQNQEITSSRDTLEREDGLLESAHSELGSRSPEDRWRSRGVAASVNTGTREPDRCALQAECVGYCVVYLSGPRMLAKNCLKTNPNWMEESYSIIRARSLPTLMIPGTHNSATYARQLDKSALQMINKYQINQDMSIFNQLMFGIRYLDLRVGYNKVKQRPERLWIYHDIFRTEISADEVFAQVRSFLDQTTHEIIIMDFHRFTVGFQNENAQVQRDRHAKLIELIFKHLGQYLVPSYLGQHAPLQEFVSSGKRLIVGYASRSQLLGSQAAAEQHHSIFGLYQAAASASERPLRDMDAYKQDLDDQPHQAATSSSDDNQTSDLRMGTRIYNRLKSLKLISHSFSKRSLSDIHRLKDGSAVADRNYELKPRQSAAKMEADGGGGGAESSSQRPNDVASIVAHVALFFPPVRHLWPNKDTLDGLAAYMNETTCRRFFGELSSLMVELTPTVFGAISDKYDGNRKLAQLANRPVTDWIRDRWLHCINIVASDFFLGNDLVRLAIHANKMRVLNRDSDGPLGEGSASLSRRDARLTVICPRFRKVEHLLVKAKIPIQFAYQPHPSQQGIGNELLNELGPGVPLMDVNGLVSHKDDQFITHYGAGGTRILLRPLSSAIHEATGRPSRAGEGSSPGQAQPRERRESFVDNVSDGFTDLFSSLKRLLSF